MPPKLRRELRPGDLLGSYVVEQRLAEGGMAEVFVGRDTRSGTAVALKRCMTRPGTAALTLQMFEREARIARALFHPHIVTTYELQADSDGNPVLIMELLQGASVERVAPWLRLSPDSAWLTCEVLAGAARALDFVHVATDPDTGRAGLVHRDVSPDNLFVTRDGMVKLIDFGLAKQTDDGRLTRVGLLKGKAAFLAPEQVAGNVIVDRRVDQYALATVAWWLFTGSCPFERDNVAATLDAIGNAPLPSLTQRVPGLPSAVDQVLARGLDRERERRFSSCEELVDALRAAAVSSPPNGAALPRLAALARAAEQGRPPSVAVAVAVGGGGGGGGGGGEGSLGQETDPQQTRPIRTLPDAPIVSDVERTFVEPAPISAGEDDGPGGVTSTESSPTTGPVQRSDEQRLERTDVIDPFGDQVAEGVSDLPSWSGAKRLLWAAAALATTVVLIVVVLAIWRALASMTHAAEVVIIDPHAVMPAEVPTSEVPTSEVPTGEVPTAEVSTPEVPTAQVPPVKVPPAHARSVVPLPAIPPPIGPQPTPAMLDMPDASAAMESQVRRVKLVAPPHIEWSAGDVLLGNGTLVAEIPREIMQVTALDTHRRVLSTLRVRKVVSYESLPRTRVRIFVRPWAEATLGEERLGVTPLPALHLVQGTYRLSLIHEGKEQVHSIEVGDKPLELRYRFGQ